MATRSITGCFTCKRRKKKCDETHPKCQRCARAGFACEGYASLENPDSRGVMRRAKYAAFVSSERPTPLPPAPQKDSTTLPPAVPCSSRDQRDVPRPSRSISVLATRDQLRNANTNDVNLVSAPHDSGSSTCLNPSPAPDSSQQLLEHQVVVQVPDNVQTTTRHPDISWLPVDHQPVFSYDLPRGSLPPELPEQRPPTVSTALSVRHPQDSVFQTSGQASLFQSLFSLAHPEDHLAGQIQPNSTNSSSRLLYGPNWPPHNEYDDSTLSDDDDPQGVKRAMCLTITPDPNTKTNALPFVLQCYARWVNFMLFDPSRVVHVMREVIIGQFSSSSETRRRIILLANVIGSVVKTPELSAKGLSIVAFLRAQAHKRIAMFNSSEPSPWRETDMQNASDALEMMMDVILVQRFSGSLSVIVGLTEAATPVFRRACPEPEGQMISLPRILLSSSMNLRNFVVTDIMISILIARPLFVRYDVTYTPEMCAQLIEGPFGLQWLHGIPDQFIILLAWISMLFQDFGSNVDPRVIAHIESEIKSVQITYDSTVHPAMAVSRLAVQECWRLAVYVYLYVTLCGAPSNDPRVKKIVRSFVHLVNGVKSGRHPDTFLSFPVMLIGAYVSRRRDRELVYQRLSGLRECTNPGLSGCECVLVLVDIWRRTDAEQRPAVWADLRLACYTVAGV